MLNFLGRLCCVAAVLAALGGCAPRSGTVGAGDDGPLPAPEDGLGAYLAGRFALAHGDTQAAADYYAAAAARDPDNLDLQQKAFTLLLAEGKQDAAAAIAAKLLVIDPEAPLPSLLLGVSEIRRGDFADAEIRFGVLPRKGINSFLGPLLSAWTKAGQGQTDAALALLAQRDDNAAFAPVYEFHRGLIAELAGRTEEAERHYLAAIASQTSVRTAEAVGGFYQRQGRMPEARAIYQRYMAERGDRSLFDGDRQILLGRAVPPLVGNAAEGLAEALFDTASLVRQGNAHDLVLAFSRLALWLRPDFPMAGIVVADTLGQQRRLAEANRVYQAIPADSQVSGFARLRRALNLDDLGEPDEAAAALNALAADQPANFEALMALGDIMRRHKRFPEAADAYDRALQRVPPGDGRAWALYYARGIALERSHRWDKAEPDFMEALRLKPDQPDVLNYLGYTWVDQGINLEQGRKMIERAVELRPNDGAIVDSLGWALYRMGDFAGAVKHLERAVELKAEDPTINEHLGDALWRVGRTEEAHFQWQRALTLDPDPDQLEGLKAKIAAGHLPAASQTK